MLSYNLNYQINKYIRKTFVWYHYAIANNTYSIIRMLLIKTGCYLKVYISDAENNEEIRIVLLGKTGAGKSASGNAILGDNVFVSKVSASSITSRCAYNSSNRFGHKIVIVDTPGIFDTSLENHHTQEEIRKCIAITSPGPHAFILVLSIQRYTDEEQNTVKHFVKHFGESVYNYVIVLFTRKDSLEEMSLQDFIETSPKELRTLIRKCGERVIAFNNKLTGAENDEQVKGLINLILRNIEKNEGLFYTHKLYEDAEKLLKKKEKALIKLTEREREIELKATDQINQVHKILSEKIDKLQQDAKNGIISSLELQEKKQEAHLMHHSEIAKLRDEAINKTQEKFENEFRLTRDKVRNIIEHDDRFLDS